MKTSRLNLATALIIITLAFSSLASVSFAAEKQQALSKKELMVLLKTAKEPGDHRRIAEYFRRQAQRLTAESKYHEEMGAIYKEHPLPYEGKHAYGTVGLSHCRYWAELDTKQAQEAEALAALHEDMAKAAEQKQ
jgi:hypothetical protein